MDSSSLKDLGAILVHKLVAAIGTEEFDILVPQLLIVAIELALALRAGYPKYFRHSTFPRGLKIYELSYFVDDVTWVRAPGSPRSSSLNSCG
jgi:hypothetical protein